MGLGELAEIVFRLCGGGIGGAGDVHAEAAGEHFRQHEEGARREAGRCGGEGGFHRSKVGGAVLPDEIEL